MRRGTHSIVVQSFVPCLMRFAGILLTSGWPQSILTVACIAAMAFKVFMQRNKMTMMTHPEYCTRNSLDPCVPHADYAQLVLQQDITHAGSTQMSIRSTPLILNQLTDQSASPSTQNGPPKTNKDSQDKTPQKAEKQKQDKAPAQDEDEFYSIFALAKQQAAEGGRLEGGCSDAY